MSAEMEIEDLKKYDKARLKEILKQTNEEMDRVNEECNVLLEILLRKRYKNISETKPFMLRVGKKRYRDNDGTADHEEELAPPVPIGRRPLDKPTVSSTSGAAAAAPASAMTSAAAVTHGDVEEPKDADEDVVDQAEVEADTMVEVDESKDEIIVDDQEVAEEEPADEEENDNTAE